MPNISTHINFINCLINNNFKDYDINYLTLGSVAPDYYIIFNNEEKGCASHFKKMVSEISNLNYFKSKFSNIQLTHEQTSYLLGYYAHLWLDNYFYYNIDNLMVNVNSSNFTTFLLNRFIKENIYIYDLRSSLHFISKISINYSDLDAANNLFPISINKALHLWSDFKFKSMNKSLELSCPTILNDTEYYKFINKASNDFLDSYRDF